MGKNRIALRLSHHEPGPLQTWYITVSTSVAMNQKNIWMLFTVKHLQRARVNSMFLISLNLKIVVLFLCSSRRSYVRSSVGVDATKNKYVTHYTLPF